jgi:hypothetical protein
MSDTADLEAACSTFNVYYKPPQGRTEWTLTAVSRLLQHAKLTGLLIEK